MGFFRRTNVVSQKSHVPNQMNRYFLALVLLSAFILFVACGTETATDTPPTIAPATTAPTSVTERVTDTPAPPSGGICGIGTAPKYIREIVIAQDVQGENYAPVNITDEYEPTQKIFHAIVSLENAPEKLQLRSVWYLVKATGYNPNTKIDENTLNVAAGGTRNVDFTLSTTQDTWPPGDYCVEVYAEGNLALSKTFTVIPNLTPSQATAAVVKQVVLAQDIDPGTFEPINPTTTYKSNVPLIHAAVQIVKAPANTRFRSRWYPPTQGPLDFDLTTSGSRWIEFRLTPAPDGFPTGEYQVEIYVNDELADTKTFTVE